ncbi:MAG: valine--tRNA ligase [Deltaproteobacteria bacterium]|nr:valine--tRNA ligase [Deltaproteobacteria bacterium]
MDFDLSKKYEPKEIEAKWSEAWVNADLYSAQENTTLPPYSIVIPPPNVTGVLHMGHALNNTLQDILIRYKHMNGFATLWVFGLDHAGIATQNVVERQLKAEGKTRQDIGREKFVERVWRWKEESGGQIRHQLKKLGASLDYNRERFTMDPGLSAAVQEVFVSLYKEGLIYRGEKLINWCPRCHTALSDLEVEHEEGKGKLWHLRYPIHGTNEVLIVATTRPETMLGDSAVALHPEDVRYQALLGKKIILPFVNREIPIIGDEYVDRQFGSGAVKITPAHDFNDFEVGLRHGLPRYNIFTEDAHLNELAGSFAGLERFKARHAIVAKLEEMDLLEKIEDYPTSIGHCYRCKTVVEPYLSMQWFVQTKGLAGAALQAVKDGRTKIIPEQWQNTYFNWLENIRDWCISRQIWWGHRIPAWYCECGEIVVSKQDITQCPVCKSSALKPETDVLDTWFSSALWPFSTLGWPDESSPLLKQYYPTSTLITGFDILFFWVARMMMLGLHFMQEVPFREVYIHALVRDAQGHKMSKSKGNVMDPLHLMEKYGTDAFRFTLAAFAAQGRDIKLAEDRVEGYRNFCNKIWNASRFIIQAALPHAKTDLQNIPEASSDEDQWILSEFFQCVNSVKQALDDYRFNDAALTLYHFFWGTYCDWYLELIKSRLYGDDLQAKQQTATVAVFILDQALRLLHPFMPFLTEELWHLLAKREGRYLFQAAFPQVPQENILGTWRLSDQRINKLQKMVSKLRQIRTETGVPASQKIAVWVYLGKGNKAEIQSLEDRMIELGRAQKITYIDQKPSEPVAKGVTGVDEILVYVPLTGLIDIEKEKERQGREIKRIQKGIDAVSHMLTSPNFAQKAPPELVQQKNQEKQELEIRKSEVEEALELLK